MCFANMKAALDTVNRKKLWQNMRGKRMDLTLAKRIEEIYKEAKNRVQVGKFKDRSVLDQKRPKTRLLLKLTIVCNIYIGDRRLLEKNTRRKNYCRNEENIHPRVCRSSNSHDDNSEGSGKYIEVSRDIF